MKRSFFFCAVMLWLASYVLWSQPARRPTTTTTTIPIDLSNPLNTVVVRVVDPGTTIAPTDTNPFSPVNTVAIGSYWVYECAKPFSPAVQTVP
jgi:hypothetical protein